MRDTQEYRKYFEEKLSIFFRLCKKNLETLQPFRNATPLGIEPADISSEVIFPPSKLTTLLII